MNSNNPEIRRKVPGNAALTDESHETIVSVPQTFDPLEAKKPSIEPILEAVHLKEDFPLRTIKLFGPTQAVHAVEDTSLALYPGKAIALVEVAKLLLPVCWGDCMSRQEERFTSMGSL
jgi:hypothetical protein